MSHDRLDTTVDIATPEGVQLTLPVAGLGARALAWLIDAAIRFTAFTVLAIVVSFFDEAGEALMLLSAFLLLWFYNVAFEVLMNGATPGKRILGLRVVNTDGTPVTWGGSIIRNLIRVADTAPAAYLFGLCSVLLTERMQRLGDLAADTLVVFQPRQQFKADFSGYSPKPVNVPLSPKEQQTLVSYAERAPMLNPSRAEELAAIVAPIVGAEGTEDLVRQAAWLTGHRSER